MKEARVARMLCTACIERSREASQKALALYRLVAYLMASARMWLHYVSAYIIVS
jgi:hypothetical protein